MAIEQTIQMLTPYVESVDVPYHLSSLFTVPQGGIHNKAKVRVHVRRSKRDIAFPMANGSTGYHENTRRGWSRKDLAPAVYKEAISITADELMGEETFGRNPFEDTNLITRAQEEVSIVAAELNELIRRGLELQASQILQTGVLTLVDDTGATVFSEDFAMKSTHKPNASVNWATTGSAVPLTDIGNSCDVIAQDGKRQPVACHMNAAEFMKMQATDSFKDAMSNQRRMYSGEIMRLNRDVNQPINPMPNGGNGGALFRGILEVKNYRLDLYVYDEMYNHPQTGTLTKYILDTKVIIESRGRMDATFGRINNFGTDGRARQYIQGRVANRTRMTDLTIVAWISPDGTTLHIGIGTRALLFPVAIDSFACLDTAP